MLDTSKRRVEMSAVLSDLILLLGANVLTVYLFATHHSSVWQVLLTYYIQTVLIAYFYYKRIYGANVTQISYRLPNAPLFRKIYELQSETATEQFLYLLVFGVPLTFMLFIILMNYSGTILFGAVPLHLNDVDGWSIFIGAAFFLIHHVFSYLLQQWEYRTGRLAQVTLPVTRIAVRVYTLSALLFFIPILISSGRASALFYLFIGLKTVLDIVLSGSYLLLKNLSRPA